MSQIDVFLKFASLDGAMANPIIQAHVSTDDDGQVVFDSDHVFPDIKVWRASQDVNGVHTYLAGYYVMVSLPSRIAQKLADLQNLAAVQIVINRDTGRIIKSNVGAALLADLRFEPVPAGADYPFGLWQT